VNAAVLTVSDRVSRGAAEDTSGDELVRSLLADGYEVDRRVVPDEAVEIAAAIAALAAGASVVLTTGGTGVAPRDVTPEATRTVLEREVPGIAEALRADAFAKTPHGLLSRGTAGIVGRALRAAAPGAAARAGTDLRRADPAPADLVMWPVMSPASWVASTKRCKDAGSAHSRSMGATEDAAAGRVIADQGAGEHCRSHH